MEAPSTEVNQTVKSAPQVASFTSDTGQRIGDNSTSAKQIRIRINIITKNHKYIQKTLAAVHNRLSNKSKLRMQQRQKLFFLRANSNFKQIQGLHEKGRKHEIQKWGGVIEVFVKKKVNQHPNGVFSLRGQVLSGLMDQARDDKKIEHVLATSPNDRPNVTQLNIVKSKVINQDKNPKCRK